MEFRLAKTEKSKARPKTRNQRIREGLSNINMGKSPLDQCDSVMARLKREKTIKLEKILGPISQSWFFYKGRYFVKCQTPGCSNIREVRKQSRLITKFCISCMAIKRTKYNTDFRAKQRQQTRLKKVAFGRLAREKKVVDPNAKLLAEAQQEMQAQRSAIRKPQYKSRLRAIIKDKNKI